MKYLKEAVKANYTIVSMDRAKVNALNLEMVEELRAVFRKIEKDDTIKGIILQGRPGIFSAGLDLIELYNYNEKEIEEFFISFGTLHIELVEFSKPFICVLNGHSPAGGTVIALGADYRIMAEGEQYGVGLNEVAVNVQISDNLIKAYTFWLGQQAAYKNILAGNLFSPSEALIAGLVDEVLKEEELLAAAEKRMKHYLGFDYPMVLKTKSKLRKQWINGLRESSDEALNDAIETWWKPEIRKKIEMFKMMLDAKKMN